MRPLLLLPTVIAFGALDMYFCAAPQPTREQMRIAQRLQTRLINSRANLGINERYQFQNITRGKRELIG